MTRTRMFIAILVVLAVAAGLWLSFRTSTTHEHVAAQSSSANDGPANKDRRVLYWYDPMHPAYKSEEAGKAPDCGMDLVPKYADERKGQ